MKAIANSLLVVTLLSGATVFSGASMGCSRNAIEAVNLANDGDKERESNPDVAISKYEQATQLDPENHRILWKLAKAYKKKEQWDKVASTCAKAEKVEKTGKFAEYYYLHGVALSKQAEKGPTAWTEAKGPLEAALQKDPNFADAYFELGNVLFHLDDEAGALKNYTKAIETKPDELAYYSTLADLYRALNSLEPAEQTLKEGISFGKENDKQFFNLHSQLGDVYEKRGNLTQAVTEYEAAKKSCGQCTEPGQAIAFFNLGAAYASLPSPRKSEAKQNLASFQKVVCKGAGAARYKDQCEQAQTLDTRMGGAMP